MPGVYARRRFQTVPLIVGLSSRASHGPSTVALTRSRIRFSVSLASLIGSHIHTGYLLIDSIVPHAPALGQVVRWVDVGPRYTLISVCGEDDGSSWDDFEIIVVWVVCTVQQLNIDWSIDPLNGPALVARC